MSNAPSLWGDPEPITSSAQATEPPRRLKRRRQRYPNGPPTDILVWLAQNEPQEFGELMDLRRALYSRKTRGKYLITLGGLTLAGEQKFIVTGPAGPLLIVSNKSRHFLLRTLCRLRRKKRWPPIVYR
jgi:hypothetical protein